MGTMGVTKCKQRGEWHRKMSYPETGVELRQDSDFQDVSTDDDVDCDAAESHHKKPHSPLADLSLGMVSRFPVDYMHLCCLGATRRILCILTKGPLKFRLGSHVVSLISDQLVTLQAFVRKEFARKPRSLRDLDRWKATELHFFILYAGPVVLQSHVPTAVHENFMLFAVGMYILLSPRFCITHVDYAEHLLINFVQHYAVLYGRDQVVYNVHTVSHLANDAKMYGPLDNVSAFPFESYLGQLKKLVRKPTSALQQVVCRLSALSESPPQHYNRSCADFQPCQKAHLSTTTGRVQTFSLVRKPTSALQQVVCRLSEQPDKPKTLDRRASSPTKEHNDGSVPVEFFGACQYKEVCTKAFYVSISQGDNCVDVNGQPVSVKNILVYRGKTYVVLERFLSVQSLFHYPCDSASLGIFFCSGRNGGLETCPLSSIANKYVVLPYPQSGCLAAIPLLHS